MNYGFVINNRDCIGCHACSTACKSENQVPLGVNRTWVKSVETGIYPDATRSFQVTRCNHCANPPCVRICPTQAMYQRDDGIVEFNNDACIGCKACLQACPYDAIYVDPETGTAAKCHYCSHRVQLDLEPACVVVCPEHAIIAGDLDNPDSEISRVLAKNQVTVRRPEQGTSPKLFYINGEDISLHPTAHEIAPDAMAWVDLAADRQQAENYSGDGHSGGPPKLRVTDNNTTVRVPQTQGLPKGGAINIADGRMAEQMTQVVYNAQHKIPWHWPVPAYLVTKGIATGIFMMLGLGWGLNLFDFDLSTFGLGGFVSLVFLAITTFFLFYDIERPERFLYILMRPQWKSWLARGAVMLIGMTTIVGIWWLLEFGAGMEWWSTSLAEAVRPYGIWIGLPFAFGAAVYTAFLFGQAEGRDLWQSTLLPFHLIVQALMMGAGSLLVMGMFMDLPQDIANVAKYVFLVAVVVDLFVTWVGEFGMPHASETAARAAHEISHGKYRMHYWGGSIVLGHLLPLILLAVGTMPVAGAIAGLAAAIGLYAYEYAFVMAPQEIPNS